MKGQRREEQQQQHPFGEDRGGGPQHAAREGLRDDLDVPHERRRIGSVDEGHSPVVVGGVETARERAVEIAQEVPLDAEQPERDPGFQRREEQHGDADHSGQQPRRRASAPDPCTGRCPLTGERCGIERQHQQGQQRRQPREVERRPGKERGDNAEAPTSEPGREYVEDFSQSSTFSILPRRTYHKNPSVFAYPISRSRRMYSRIWRRWLSGSSSPNL